MHSQVLKCAMCARGLDDALILSCDHNLCLGCAAVSLRRSQAQGNGRGIYCQLCGAHTVVDGASAQTLLEQPPPPGQAVGGGTAMGAMGGPPMHGGGAPMGTAAAGGMPGSYGGGADPSFGGYGMANRGYGGPPSTYGSSMGGAMGAGGGAFGGMGARGQLGSPSPSAPNFGVGAGPAARPAAAIACREHPDERVQYFCHTCETPAVCAECVIHGVHKEHDVQQLRRAYPVIKSKVEDFLFTVGSRIEELAAVESRIEAHRRELANAVMAAKQQMGKAFEEVRQRLAKKEMELMQNADAFLHESHSELEGHLRTAREKTRGLEETSSKIRSHINTSDEVGLLNYYADVKGFLQSTLATTDHQQLANLPEAAARRVLANINHTNDHIEALQQLHSAISNLRSLEPSDGQQPQSLGAGGGMQQERGLTGGGGGGLGYSDRPLSGGGGQRRPYDAY